MATVFAGERLLGITQLNDSSQGDLNPEYTYYTVPAGEWVKVTMHLAECKNFGSNANLGQLIMGVIPFADGAMFNSSGVGNAISLWSASGMIDTLSADYGLAPGPQTYILESGQRIYKNGASGTNGLEIWCTIQRFANP